MTEAYIENAPIVYIGRGNKSTSGKWAGHVFAYGGYIHPEGEPKYYVRGYDSKDFPAAYTKLMELLKNRQRIVVMIASRNDPLLQVLYSICKTEDYPYHRLEFRRGPKANIYCSTKTFERYCGIADTAEDAICSDVVEPAQDAA